MNIALRISESGTILEILDKSSASDRVIAKILVHGFFKRAMHPDNNYVFRGELFQLAGYEYLDSDKEIITEYEGNQ